MIKFFELENTMRAFIQFLCLLFITSLVSAQELKLPSLSPLSTVSQEFSTSKIEIAYSRPSMRGRKIFGDLVQYGQVWRTGANAATKLTISEELVIGGSIVKPGSYSLYSIPGQTEFTIIINKNTGGWPGEGWPKEDDVARFTVPVTRTSNAAETFSIDVANITFSSCTIDILWENTLVSIPVKANNQDRLLTSIDRAINSPNIPYQQAATYLFETGQNLDKALEYAGKALERNPKAYWVALMKARIAAKLGRNDVAREAANKTIEIVKAAGGDDDYERAAQDVIKSLK
jgi:hypothetical protein